MAWFLQQIPAPRLHTYPLRPKWRECGRCRGPCALEGIDGARCRARPGPRTEAEIIRRTRRLYKSLHIERAWRRSTGIDIPRSRRDPSPGGAIAPRETL